ncbi:MAG: hypothetical protein IAE78_20235 [Myxococcus sp.]|nr:hypothetical protein [Myxococcus sp.]
MRRTTWLALGGTLLVTGGLLLLPKPSTGAPFTPASLDEVLEQVPVRRAGDAGLSAEAAAEVARALITQSRQRGGDTRLLGQAQAVLAPWWSDDAPAPAVRLMRATIKQSLHDFDGALEDLDVLAATPTDVQAQLTRATVLSVRARYREAEPVCLGLRGQVEDAVVAACLAPLLAIQGRAEEAEVMVRAALAKTSKASTLRGWLLSILGEVQTWRGNAEGAVATLREALAADDTDTYSRLLLGATLTELARPAEAVALWASRVERSDPELLELVLAARAAHLDEADALAATLAQNVEASRRRKDPVHRREESRYALRVEGDVPRALALARENFEVQQEPADVRVLLEAALAARDRAAAAPALAWMKRTGFAAPRFVSLAAAVESLP